MNNKQYEMFEKNKKVFYYDRINHCVKNENDSLLNTAQKFRYICSIYPYKVLKKVIIPKFLLLSFMVISTILFFYSVVCFCSFFGLIKTFFFNNQFYQFMFIPLIIIFSIFLHELSHAITGTNLGGIIAELGIRRKGLAVTYFTEIIWTTNNPIWRMEYYFSGIAMNMFICGISIQLLFYSKYILFLFTFIINLIFVVLNLLPFRSFKSDGFNILYLIKCLKIKKE